MVKVLSTKLYVVQGKVTPGRFVFFRITINYPLIKVAVSSGYITAEKLCFTAFINQTVQVQYV